MKLSCARLALVAFWLAWVARVVGGDRTRPYDGIDLILAALVCIALTFWQPLLSQWGMMTIPLWTWLENRLYSRRGMGAVG